MEHFATATTLPLEFLITTPKPAFCSETFTAASTFTLKQPFGGAVHVCWLICPCLEIGWSFKILTLLKDSTIAAARATEIKGFSSLPKNKTVSGVPNRPTYSNNQFYIAFPFSSTCAAREHFLSSSICASVNHNTPLCRLKLQTANCKTPSTELPNCKTPTDSWKLECWISTFVSKLAQPWAFVSS